MSNKRRKPETSKDARLAAWLRPACLGCATALSLAAPLVASERTELTGAALPATMLWLLTALVWFAGAWLLRQPIPRWSSVEVAAIVFVALVGISGVAMMRFGSPRLTLNAVWTWVGMGTAFILFRQLLRGDGERRALCAVFIGLAVCLSLVALHQTFIAFPQARALYESNPDAALQLAGVEAAAGSMQRKQFESRLYSTEPYATFSLTNSLAGFIAPWLALLVAVASSRRVVSGEGKTRRLEAFSTWLIAAPLVICLLLTKSRSAWLATLLGLVVIGVIRIAGGQRPATSQRLAVIAVVSLVALTSALFAAIGIFDIDIVAQAGRSLAFRLEYWQATLAMIADYPLLGIGVGNFQEYYTAYKLPQASETIADPHNFTLEIAASAGVPAFVAFVAIFVASAFALRRDVGQRELEETGKQDAYPTGVRAIFIGGLVGVPLAIMLGLVTGYMPDIEPLLFGAVGGALAVWLLRGWVEQGALPRWAIVVAIGVLLVNLLAAGGIGFPGVAITLWLLLAILAGDQRPATGLRGPDDSSQERNGASRWHSAICAIVTAILLAVCSATAYQPVLARTPLSLAMSDAQAAGHIDDAIRLAEAAAAADRWSADPQLQLAQLYHQRWSARTGPASTDHPDYRAFQLHGVAGLMLNPRAFSNYAAMAYLEWEAGERTGDAQQRTNAASTYELAVEQYPNDALVRAQFAWLLDQAGRRDEAEREAAEALRLDALCPHSERKLAQRRLFTEVTSAPQQARMPAELRTLDAELWMHRLRRK